MEMKRNRTDAAIALYGQTLKLWKQMRDLRGKSCTLVHYGEALLVAGRRRSACERLAEALRLIAVVGGTSILGTGLNDLSATLQSHGLEEQHRVSLDHARASRALPSWLIKYTTPKSLV